MKIMMSNRWDEADLNVHMVTNFTDVRAAVNMTDEFNVLIANETYITKVEDELINGDCVVYNQTEVREFHFVLNGKDMDNRANMVITGHRCVVNCELAAVEEVSISDEVIYWSDPASWPSGELPVEGEEVEIIPGVNMMLDIDTPLLKSL